MADKILTYHTICTDSAQCALQALLLWDHHHCSLESCLTGTTTADQLQLEELQLQVLQRFPDRTTGLGSWLVPHMLRK